MMSTNWFIAVRGKASGGQLLPLGVQKAPPRLTPWPQTAPGSQWVISQARGGHASLDEDQTPLLTDVISCDGQRLRLFFQLGLLEDSGRAAVGLM